MSFRSGASFAERGPRYVIAELVLVGLRALMLVGGPALLFVNGARRTEMGWRRMHHRTWRDRDTRKMTSLAAPIVAAAADARLTARRADRVKGLADRRL